jgi:hypothetical protein
VRRLLVVAVTTMGLLPASAAWADVQWGADAFSAPPGAVDAAEAAMGANFESHAIYANLDRPATLHGEKTAKAIAENALVYLNINSTRIDGSGTLLPICWTAVRDGKWDDELHEWTRVIKELGYTNFLVTFNHEPTWNSKSQPKCAPKYDNATTYKAAFNHVRNLFKADGVNFPWAYVMVAGATNWPSGLEYRPAPRNYQVIGTDQYYHCDDRFQKPPDAFKSFFAWTAKYAVNKPVLVGEIGANVNCPDQSLVWLQAAQTRLLAHNLLSINWNLRSDGRFQFNPLLQPDVKAWWLDWAYEETAH